LRPQGATTLNHAFTGHRISETAVAQKSCREAVRPWLEPCRTGRIKARHEALSDAVADPKTIRSSREVYRVTDVLACFAYGCADWWLCRRDMSRRWNRAGLHESIQRCWWQRKGKKTEGVLSRGKQCHRHWRPARSSVEDLRLQPVGEAPIANVRLPAPEIRRQRAVNMKMPQQQLDRLGVAGEIAPRVARANVDSSHDTTVRLRPHHHGSPIIARPAQR
jgi:hypothetical protein